VVALPGNPHIITRRILAERVEDHFLVALTYGPEVDWYRNVLAAGACTLVWHRHVYRLDQPEPMAAESALPLFPPPQRLILRLLCTRHFVRFSYAGGGPLGGEFQRRGTRRTDVSGRERT
jgi:hypothetical protein